MKTLNATHQAAYAMADRGIRVIALSHGSKLPRKGSHGANDGTTDRDLIDSWFETNDNKWMNVGISTGSIKDRADDHTRVIVIDDDSAKHGTRSLIERFCDETGYEWPHTWSQSTGNGGTQYMFADPECKIRKGGAKDVDADGNPIYCDVRADGNFCVICPSYLIKDDGSYGFYQWNEDCSPDDCDLAPVDEVVEAFYRYWSSLSKKGAARSSDKVTDSIDREYSWYVLPEKVSRGCRNNTMFGWLGVLVAMGLTDDTIANLAYYVNDAVFDPPIADHEMEVLLGSASNYKKGSKAWKTNAARAYVLQYFVRRMLSKVPDNQLAFDLTCIFNDCEISEPFEAEDIARFMNALIHQGASISDEVIDYE